MVLGSLVLGCVAILTIGIVGCSRDRSPNILLITLDTTRPDFLGVYGREPSPSPHLDRFAASARVYTRAYSPSSWTLPAHASLFTGVLPLEHLAGAPGPTDSDRPWGVLPLPERFDTLAEHFSRNGYATAAVIGGPAMAVGLGLDQGFESYDADFPTFTDKWHGKRANYIADRAIEYIKQAGDQPYFLFVNFFDPHRPYHPPASIAAHLPKDPSGEFDETILARLGTRWVAMEALPDDLQQQIAALHIRYEAEIRFMDQHLARLLEAADATGDGLRPIIIVTSDHGESFGEHNYTLHGLHLYEDNVRVPLIIRDSRSDSSSVRVDTPVSTRSLFRFLLRTATNSEPNFPGWPAAGSTEDVSQEIFTQVWAHEIGRKFLGKRADRDLRALYDFPFKLIESTDGRVELYDVDRDPAELSNLVEAHPNRVASMRARLVELAGPNTQRLPDGAAAELSPNAAAALEALGYLDEQP